MAIGSRRGWHRGSDLSQRTGDFGEGRPVGGHQETALEGDLEEFDGSVRRATGSEENVVEAEGGGPVETAVWVGVYPGNQLAEDNAKGEDVGQLVVELFLQTFRTHEIRRSDLQKELEKERRPSNLR